MKNLLTLSLIFIISSCSLKEDISKYKSETPELDIREYFNGDLKSWGMVQDWKGDIVQRFTVDINGKWDGDKGVLNEDFYFADGTTDNRVWKIEFTDKHNFIATANDVVGEAKGVQKGNSVNMEYVLEVPIDGTIYNITVDDYLYMIDEGKLISVSPMRKFGLNVGTITIAFEKL